MRCKLAFAQTSDGRLLVITEAIWGFPATLPCNPLSVPVEDENEFLQRIVFANLGQQQTIDVIGKVLLTLAGRHFVDPWTSLEVTELQLQVLGVMPGELLLNAASRRPFPAIAPPEGFPRDEDLTLAVMQAPLAICMMVGPEHAISFINDAYVRIVSRSDPSQLLDKPIREALYELEGQPFFDLLDRVYRNGEAFVGQEVRALLSGGEPSDESVEKFFDFIYYPVRDRDGEVCGILAQATDVTERVLEKQVRDSREEQLYRQWAEMDAIYRQVPVGICLIDVKTGRVLRTNELKAVSIGSTAEKMIGRRIADLTSHMPKVAAVYAQALVDHKPRLIEYTRIDPHGVERPRVWMWSVTPVLGASGEVVAIASLVLEVTDRHRKDADRIEEIVDASRNQT